MSSISPTATRSLALAGAVVGVLLCVFAVRVVTSAASELERGAALQTEGDTEGAIIHLRRAARWYAPGSPYHVRALSRLAEIGAAAEHEGETERALSAYRAIRGSILATRSFYVPERERLEAANARIADLMASLPPPPMDAGKSREQIRGEHLALLQADPGPDVLWTLVLLIGFLAWVGGAFAFTLRAVDDDDHFVVREALRWGAVIAVGFGLFVLGMVLA